jgi:hypothetical protein
VPTDVRTQLQLIASYQDYTLYQISTGASPRP